MISTRTGIAAQAVGLAQGALDEALTMPVSACSSARPIIANQAVQWMLADMATEIEAARALTYAVCRYVDSGQGLLPSILAMAKLLSRGRVR